MTLQQAVKQVVQEMEAHVEAERYRELERIATLRLNGRGNPQTRG